MNNLKDKLNICPECNTKQKTQIDIWFFKKSGRCSPCQKKWMALPENDPEYKKFVVEARTSVEFTIYAKTQEEAEQKAMDELIDIEADGWFDVNVREIERKINS